MLIGPLKELELGTPADDTKKDIITFWAGDIENRQTKNINKLIEIKNIIELI